jgi:phosphoribosylaminoimidazole-succinocarboxamide synthase
MSADNFIYEGKAKKIYQSEKPDEVFIAFKDELTAFNALKKGSFENKGRINRDIASLIFKMLQAKGISSHFVKDQEPCGFVAKKVDIIPLEVVVRNILAGSTAKKLGIDEGKVLKKPLVEFYYKKDELADPFVSDDQIVMMEIADQKTLDQLKVKALAVNENLKEFFAHCGIDLVDFKIEFGLSKDKEILLADEITPDCCRLWDHQTGEKMDKDRFRRDLGNIKSSYEEVLKRLEGLWAQKF